MHGLRRAGLPAAAGLLLTVGAARVWEQTGVVGGLLLGAGLTLLGVAVRDWLDHHTHDQEDHE